MKLIESIKTANTGYSRILNLIVFLFFVQLISFAQKKFTTIEIPSNARQPLGQIFNKYDIYAINTFEISDYAKGNKKRDSIFLDLDFPGKPLMKIHLEEYSIIDEKYQLTLGTVEGQTKILKSDYITYKGQLTDDPNSKVYLTISGNNIFGFIKGKNKEYFIEPHSYFNKNADKSEFVLYESKDVIPKTGVSCGVLESAEKIIQLEKNSEARIHGTGTCKIVELAIASDTTMMNRYGNAIAVEEHNIGIMNIVVGIYDNTQIGTEYLQFKIVGQYIASSAGVNPLTPNYGGNNASIILENFKNWGQAGNFGVAYDLAQIWTTRDIGTTTDGTNFNYGVVGLAFVGATCTSSKYQLIEDLNIPANGRALIVAHETGHNLGAQHDTVDGFIMNANLNLNATSFSTASLTTMLSYMPNFTCLSGCNTTLPVAGFYTPKVFCGLGPINISSSSVGDHSATIWNMPGGTPATANTKSISVQYSTPGLKTITLTALHSDGIKHDSYAQEIFVDNPVIAACRTSIGGNSEYASISSFALADINHTASPVFIGGHYENYTCTNPTILRVDSTYIVKANIGLNQSSFNYQNKLQVFIDYNNDGDFTDAGELIHISPSCVQGSYSFNYTVPPTVPTMNRLLRMRVISMPCSLAASDGCNIPSNASIEDYSVVYLGRQYPYYVDFDADGWGSATSKVYLTTPTVPTGLFSSNNYDCNDISFDGFRPSRWILDQDNDGYYAGNIVFGCNNPGVGYKILGTHQPGDCNDSNNAVNPGAPPLVFTKNITAQLSAAGTVTITPAQVNNGTLSCKSLTFSLSKTSFNCTNVGTNSVILTATDASGNTASGTATVTIEDKVIPTVITKNITANIDAGGLAEITPAQINNGSFDACGLLSLTLDKTRFFCHNFGINTVILTATDVNGNTSTATATVTIVDTTIPTVITQNISVQLDASGNIAVADRDVDNGSFDACGLVLYQLSKKTFDCSNLSVNTVTLTVKDINNNIATGTATITVTAAPNADLMKTKKSGNWTDPAVWTCGRLPLATDKITILTGHTISVPTGSFVVKNIVCNGIIQLASGSQIQLSP